MDECNAYIRLDRFFKVSEKMPNSKHKLSSAYK